MSRAKQTRAGQRRDRVIIYRQDPTQTANTDGEIPEKAQEIARRWAQIRPKRGQVRQLPGSKEADVLYEIRLPFDKLTKDLTPKNWLVIKANDKRLNITGVFDPDGRQKQIEVEATERLT